MSLRLTPAQRRGLARVGDVMIPGDDALPSFSAAGILDRMDDVLPHLYAEDRAALLTLLDVFARLPRPGVRAIVAAASRWASAPEPLAAGLRMVNFALKGVVHALYWSDLSQQGIHAAIGYDARIDETAHGFSEGENR
ncbi:hypothetical protein HJ590_13850 [Naumannella sp. ID2617S]|nr:hypothetical protein [Enemella dayhoffiae]NNG20622.1 hypothetical protein [Naumannella sp. ID2617S]